MEARAISAEQTHNSEIVRCLHCDAPTSGGEFCCTGCEAAYCAVQKIGGGSSNQEVIFSPFVNVDDEGNNHITYSVKGIHCASCIQLIENALYGQSDVENARVNMSTERLIVSWKGKKERADALAKIVSDLGYQVKSFNESNAKKESKSEEKFLLKCLAIAGFAMGNLMMISVGLWASDGKTMGMATQDFFHLISAIIAIPAVFYSGRPFFYSAISVLKGGHTNMDVPISIAVTLATLMSVFEAFNQGEHVYFDSAVMLLFFLLIGRYLDHRAKGKAKESATELLSMLHGTATVIENGKTSAIPISELREGMEVLVAMGENIPADGAIIKGESQIDMSLITGETMPQGIKIGDEVFAGTVNLSTPLRLKVSKASDSSLLSDIVKLMEKAEQGQAKYVRLADKAARLYTPVVHSMGLLTFLGWWLLMSQPWQPSLLNAITVLIITCPCALGLAVPVVQVLASGKLMKGGILLKSGDALEKLAKVDVAVFDKTGTLTLGKPSLLEGKYTEENLKIAASLASHSKHPLSKAICSFYNGELLEVEDLQEISGKGLQGVIGGKQVRLGNRNWCAENAEEENATLELWLLVDGEQPVQFTFSDALRSDAKQVIKQLQQRGIKTYLLSGDRQQTVEKIASKVGIENYQAKLTPTQKCDFIEEMKANGHKVLMVGDGLNDAPALATADVSISPSTAMDISQNTADIVFQGEGLQAVLNSIKTASMSEKLVKQNFMLAVIYNIIAIPMAVMGYVTPLVAAIAMSGSSLVVIGNSFRLNLQR